MRTTQIKRNTLHIVAIAVSAFLLCVVAFYNGFPLAFNNDSGVYIYSGFSGEVKVDRPIIYGFFIALTSIKYSLWLVVFTHALIVSLVVYYFFKYVISTPGYIFYYIVFIAVVSFLMGAAFEVAWLMPDVFTASTLLCALLLIFCNTIEIWNKIVISILLVISITVHNSHSYICIIFSCFVMAGYFIKNIRSVYEIFKIKLKKVFYVIALAIFSSLISATIHHHYGGGFKSSYGGAIFLMSNLIEMGVVDSYLDESCQTKNYRLCQYKDSIPNNFLWDKNSPLRKTGGWIVNNDEYFTMEKEMITTPKYIKKISYKSVIYTVKQFFNYDIVHATTPTDLVKNSIEDNFPHEYNAYMNARQATGKLHFGFINYTQNMMVGLCMFAYIFILYNKRYSDKFLLIFAFILAGVIINAIICSVFSGVYPRYQTRVAWLLPLPLFVYIMENRVFNFVRI